MSVLDSIPSLVFLIRTSQNFFTIVKALVNQAHTDGVKLDNRHHYEELEIELTKWYVSLFPVLWKVDWATSQSASTKASHHSVLLSVIHSIPPPPSTLSANSCHVLMSASILVEKMSTLAL